MKQIDIYRVKINSSGKKAAAAKKTAFTAPNRLKKIKKNKQYYYHFVRHDGAFCELN